MTSDDLVTYYLSIFNGYVTLPKRNHQFGPPSGCHGLKKNDGIGCRGYLFSDPVKCGKCNGISFGILFDTTEW